MSLSVQTIRPDESFIPMPKSTSKHILKKRQVEILPLESTQFSYSGNDSIKFNISSNTELLDGLDSYIKMGFLTTTDGGASATKCLDIGGAHALFREVELRTQNGTLIQRYDRYNRWYAMMSCAQHSPMHVELVEASAGDSVGYKKTVGAYKHQGVKTFSTVSLAEVYYDDAGNDLGANVLVLGGNAATAGSQYEVKAGDIILIGVAANLWFAEVASVTSGGGIILVDFAAANNRNLPAADIAATNILSLGIISKGDEYVPQRAVISQVLSGDNNLAGSTYANGVPLCFKPDVSFLKNRKWIPLAFIKQGLQLELKLERPDYCLNKGRTPSSQDSANSLSYTIYSPRYVAMLITPDETLMGEYLNQFNNEGIHMSILAYKYARNTVNQSASGSQVISNNFGVRSARTVFSIIQSSRISEDVSAASQNNFSLSTFFRSNVSSYQYKSGSEEYPMRAVNCDKFSTEAFQQLMLSTGQYGGTLWNVRFSPEEWRSENTVISSTSAAATTNVSLTNRSTKFIMSTRLDRGEDNFTGLDLSLNPLDLELDLSAVEVDSFGNRVVQHWVSFDLLVSLSKDGLVCRR